jgi:hypothetical protein
MRPEVVLALYSYRTARAVLVSSILVAHVLYDQSWEVNEDGQGYDTDAIKPTRSVWLAVVIPMDGPDFILKEDLLLSEESHT